MRNEIARRSQTSGKSTIKMKSKEQHVDKLKSGQDNEISIIKTIDSSVFENFKKLTSNVIDERINGSLFLLQHLTKLSDNEKKDKEIQYVLKRIVRGLGASTTVSRAGFFSAFVGFLKLFFFNGVSVNMILDVCKTQLHVGKVISSKEDSDAIVGQILTCGGILRSGKICHLSSEDIRKIVEILITTSRCKNYHNSLAFSFIVELIQNVDANKFTESLWPSLEIELKKPWNKQTINTIFCLIAAITKHQKIVSIEFLESNLGGPELLNSSSYDQLFKLFFENATPTHIIHPAYEQFGRYIAKCENLENFWVDIVSSRLASPNKSLEIATLKILVNVIYNVNSDFQNVSKLFTENVVNMLVKSLKSMKLKKDKTLQALYDDLFKAINNYCIKVADDEKIEIIRKLILHPGILNIEKFTSSRIIHQIVVHLGESGVKDLSKIYKNIFLDMLPKNPTDKSDVWLNVERQNAGYMLQSLLNHKSIQNSFDWKTKQLKSIMTIGLFSTDNKGNIINEISDSDLLPSEFATQSKNIFFTSLQTKLSRLEDEKKMLLELVKTCNKILKKKNFNDFLREKFNKNILKTWNRMYTEVNQVEVKTESKLQLVFHILLLHMGLQLFKEPEMAEPAILDLEKCIEKSKKKTANKTSVDDNEEPEWIEVVVDLFLHLLSQNINAFRIVVNSVFPHLCDELSLTAVHQILSVLDMKNQNNPLTGDIEDEIPEEEDEESHKKDENEESESSDDSEKDDDEEDDIDEEEIVEQEEDESMTTKVRCDLSAALKSAFNYNDDDDVESVNLDDMDEEEGIRLDKLLSDTFRCINKSRKQKRSKHYRVKLTSLMHFRIRVLDLIEIYIQHKPKMLIAVEIMFSLYNMIEFCVDKELEPLMVKVDKVLSKLTTLKHISEAEDINSDDVCNYLGMIIDKKVNAPAFEMHNKFKTKCCIFLISCGKYFSSGPNDAKHKNFTGKIVKLFEKYLNEFITSRNPVVTIALLNDIFKTRWQGVWKMAEILVQNGLANTTRRFRRIQILELIDLLYKNHEFIRQDLVKSEKKCKIIEPMLQNYMLSLKERPEIFAKEFSSILDVLFSMNKCHNKTGMKIYIDKEIVCNEIQELRRKVKLDNTHSYTRICGVFNLKILKNRDIDKPDENIVKNGVSEKEVLMNGAIHEEQQSNKIKTKKGKRKGAHTNDFRKEKKLKKEERMKIASEGINGTFSFAETKTNTDDANGY